MATKTTVKKPIKLVNKKNDYLIIDWDNCEVFFCKKEELQSKLYKIDENSSTGDFNVIDLDLQIQYDVTSNKKFDLTMITSKS